MHIGFALNRIPCAFVAFSAALPCAAAQDNPDPKEPERGSYIVEFVERDFDLEALARAMREDDPNAVLRVEAIVAELERKVERHQRAFVERLEALGGRCTKQLWIVNACAVEIGAAALPVLRAFPNVRRITEDSLRAPAFLKTATNAANHAVDGLHRAGVRGKGVTVAILDSGVDDQTPARLRPHRAFYLKGDPKNTQGGGIAGSRLLVSRAVGRMRADDIIGHGTSVAAVAAGENWGTAGGDSGHAPEAKIASYSIADTNKGLALISTIAMGFQTVVLDAKRLGIKVVNLSYDGTNNSQSIEQMAIDVAARVADVVITVSAGNAGADLSKWIFAHGSTNRLAVGAVAANTRKFAPFTTRSLPNGEQYPNLLANGVGMVMPQADSESVDRTADGTSYAAPNVAGAAALYRSVATTASALETRAAILATCEDVRMQNPSYRRSLGYGYLRDGLLVAAAQRKNSAVARSATVSRGKVSWSMQFPVQAWRPYAVGLAWNRINASVQLRTNLELDVVEEQRFGGRVLASSNKRFVAHERLHFRVDRAQTVTIRVRALAFEPGLQVQPFSVVATESLPYWVDPSQQSVGKSCRFSQREPHYLTVSPSPVVGTSYSINVVGSRRVVPFVTFVGLSMERFGNLRLPLALDAWGAPGCTLYVSPDFFLGGGVTSGIGLGITKLALPNWSSLVGVELGHQIFGLDAQYNKLGVVPTDAVRATIGGFVR